MSASVRERVATLGRTCMRELLFMAVIIGMSMVILPQRIVRDICSVAEQQHGQQSFVTAGPAADIGPYRGLCSSIAPRPGPSRSMSRPAAAQVLASYPLQLVAGALWWLQATAQLIWLQVTVVGDLEVAAYITSHVIMLAFLLGPAWRLHQVAPKRRHLVYTCVRLIHAAAVPLAVATSAAPQYFVVEMLLQAARWRVFAAAGWIHALLLQVPPRWQVPLGVAEYACLAVGCTWLNAAAGRPPNTLLQHLWELAMCTLLPTALIWWWSRRFDSGQDGAAAAWGQQVVTAGGAPVAACTHKAAHKGCPAEMPDVGSGPSKHAAPDKEQLVQDEADCIANSPVACSSGSTSSRLGVSSPTSNSKAGVGQAAELDDAQQPTHTAATSAAAAAAAAALHAPQLLLTERFARPAAPEAAADRAMISSVEARPLQTAAAAASSAYRCYQRLEYVPVTRTYTLAFKVDTSDFPGQSGSVLATVTHTLEQSSSRSSDGGSGGRNSSPEQQAMLQTCVAVPGCVLILAQLTSLGPAGQLPMQQMQGGGDAASSCLVHTGSGCCGACRPALDGSTWTVKMRCALQPPTAAAAAAAGGGAGTMLGALGSSTTAVSGISSGSSGNNPAVAEWPGAASLYFPTLQHMQQALRGGALTNALQTMRAAPQMAAAGPAAAQGGTSTRRGGSGAAPASCCPTTHALIGTWGQRVKLQLQWPPGGLPGLSATGHAAPAAAAAAGDQGGAAGAVAGGAQLRVVVSRHRSVVLDTALAVPVEGGEGGALLTLQPPALAAAAGVGPGGSAPAAAAAAAAALSVDIMWAQEEGPDRQQQQQQQQGVPPTVTHASLLLLEEPVAGELVTWVTTHRVTACALSVLVQDMAVLLATRQQMQAALQAQAAARAISIPTGQGTAPPEPAAAAAAAAAAATAAAASSNALKAFRIALPLADHLEAYLRSCGLHLTCDMVVGVKQQLLLASVQLQPLAAGVTGSPSREVGSTPGTAAGAAASAADSPAQGHPSSSSVGGSSGAPGEAVAGASGWCAHLTATPSHPAAAEAAAAGAAGAAAMAAGGVPPPAAVVAVGALRTAPAPSPAGAGPPAGTWHMPDLPAGASSSGTGATPVKPKSTGGKQDSVMAAGSSSAAGGVAAASSTQQGRPSPQHVITEGDRDAVAAGGWRGALLCWRGFACTATEAAYLQYKADHLWLWDCLCQVYFLTVLLQMAWRFVKMTGQGLWPLHRVYGSYWIAERAAHVSFMLLDRSRWRRHRSTWLLLYSVRGLVWMSYEAYMWPQDLLAPVQGDTNKVLLFLPINALLALNVPRAMVWTWFCFNPPFVWLSLARATPDTPGVGALVYWLRQRGGVPLLLYCLGLTVVNLGVVMVEAVVSDLWGRQVFVKQQGATVAGTRGRRQLPQAANK